MTGALVAAARAGSAADASPRDAYIHLAAGEVQLAAAIVIGSAPLFGSAAASLETALDLDPRLVEARTTLGKLAMARADPQLAAANYRAALAIDESHAPSYAGLGWAELSLGNPGAAAEAFARATGNDSDSFDAALGHAISLCRTGKLDEGRAALSRAASLSRATADEARLTEATGACR